MLQLQILFCHRWSWKRCPCCSSSMKTSKHSTFEGEIPSTSIASNHAIFFCSLFIFLCDEISLPTFNLLTNRYNLSYWTFSLIKLMLIRSSKGPSNNNCGTSNILISFHERELAALTNHLSLLPLYRMSGNTSLVVCVQQCLSPENQNKQLLQI